MYSLPPGKNKRNPFPQKRIPRQLFFFGISSKEKLLFGYSAVKGNRAMIRALLIAVVSIRWCQAQFPEILRGSILPRSVMYFFRRGTSL
jgi:hypothetical protein